MFVVFCAPRSARRRELAATAKTRPAPTVVLPKTAHKNTSPQTPGSPPLPHAASSLRSSPRSGGAPGAASVCAPPPDPAQKKTFVILSEAKDLLFAHPQPRHTRKRREARRVGPSRIASSQGEEVSRSRSAHASPCESFPGVAEATARARAFLARPQPTAVFSAADAAPRAAFKKGNRRSHAAVTISAIHTEQHCSAPHFAHAAQRDVGEAIQDTSAPHEVRQRTDTEGRELIEGRAKRVPNLTDEPRRPFAQDANNCGHRSVRTAVDTTPFLG